jgi:hypothetical protein
VFLNSSRAFAPLLVTLLTPVLARADDGAVNLADLGMDGFTPYLTERHEAWIALPALAVALLLVHLQRNRKKRHSSGGKS